MSEPRPFSDRWIIRGKIGPDPDRVLTSIKVGDWAYLSFEPQSRYYEWTSRLEWAYPFADLEEAKKVAAQKHGPWQSAPDPSTLEVIEVVYHPPATASIQIKPHGK